MIDTATANELVELTSKFLNRPDLIQGPGGNTSVKNSEGTMFIKASGYRFEELRPDNGISAVSYQPVRDYFFQVIPEDKAREEARMLEIVQSNVLRHEDGSSYPKPSMETGFHAVLRKYVVHTHSVWANLLNCCSDRLNMVKQIKLDYQTAFIPFVSPGFGLSYLVASEIKKAEAAGTAIPDIFFLANHGIIAHADEPVKCKEMLDAADAAIQKVLNLSVTYPEVKLKGSEHHWESNSGFVPETLSKHGCDKSFFDKVLFPDQTVFFKDRISDWNDQEKRVIDLKANGSVVYNCSYREAISIHETMTAYLYLFDVLTEIDLPMDVIDGSEIDYINGMEMEKHRKQIN